MRKATLLVGTISIWAMLIFTVEGLTWDLTSKGANSYSKMLIDLRKQVQGTTCFGIPMINKTPKASYVFVDLKASSTQTISVALKTTDLYVVAYADTYGTDPKTGKPLKRAFVLKPEKKGEDYKDAFPNAKVEPLPYTGSYRDLENPINAGDRRKLDLTRAAIQGLVKEIYGKKIDNKDIKKKQAQFLLTAIQMIAEAARFKYIEEQVKRRYDEYHFKMDGKMYALANKWDTISTAIVNAKPNGAFIKKENGKEVTLTLVLVGPNGEDWEVSNVEDVRKDMALLKSADRKCAKTLSLQYVTSEWPLALAHMLAQA